MAKIVRREHGYAGGGASAADCRSQPISCHVLEHAPIQVAVVARAELEHGRENNRCHDASAPQRRRPPQARKVAKRASRRLTLRITAPC